MTVLYLSGTQSTRPEALGPERRWGGRRGPRGELQPGSPAADEFIVSLRLVALAMATILALGCFVSDELDSAKDLMEHPSFSKQQKKEPHAAEQPQAAPENAYAHRPSEGDWWKKTHSLTSGEVSNEFVRCELHGATEFMRRPDCLARGGTPHQAGG
jgi:hypothetical protein